MWEKGVTQETGNIYYLSLLHWNSLPWPASGLLGPAKPDDLSVFLFLVQFLQDADSQPESLKRSLLSEQVSCQLLSPHLHNQGRLLRCQTHWDKKQNDSDFLEATIRTGLLSSAEKLMARFVKYRDLEIGASSQGLRELRI